MRTPSSVVPGDRAEGQRAVVVADDDDVRAVGCRERGGGLVEDQPVAGVDGVQVRRLEVGVAPQLLEHVGLVAIHTPEANGVLRRPRPRLRMGR